MFNPFAWLRNRSARRWSVRTTPPVRAASSSSLSPARGPDDSTPSFSDPWNPLNPMLMAGVAAENEPPRSHYAEPAPDYSPPNSDYSSGSSHSDSGSSSYSDSGSSYSGDSASASW